MSHEAPYTMFLEMIARLEQAAPLRANKQRWAVWARDVAQFRMEAEVPLRPKNIVELALGRNVKRDTQTGAWRLFAPKAALKNFYSGHAEDIDRVFSEVTSSAISRYVDEARGDMVGGREPVLLVMKKNVSPLSNLIEFLDSQMKKGVKKLDLPLLVVDDEADNASVNGRKDEEPATINRLIRELLDRFSRASYVAYTATRLRI